VKEEVAAEPADSDGDADAQWTAEMSAVRPDLRRYDRLIATMRKASNPSRSVMTSA
jgi:hypothetical protein